MAIFGGGVSFVLFLAFVFGVKYEYSRKSPILLFYFALFFMFFIPSLDGVINGGRFPSWVYVEAQFFALSYLIVFFVTRYFLERAFGLVGFWGCQFRRLKYLRFQNEAWFYLAFVVISFLLVVFALDITSISKAMAINWWDFVRSGSSLVILSTYFAYCSSPLLLLAYADRVNSWKRFSVNALAVVFYALFAVFVLKTRSYVLVHMVPFFLFLLYRKGIKDKLSLLFLSGLMVFLYIVARAVRHAQDLTQFFDFGLAYFWDGAASGVETDFVDAFFYFIYEDGNFPGFGENITLQRVLLFWLPSLGNWVKPVDFSFYMHSAYFGSAVSEGFSMHPTIFGDAYGNFGSWGAILYAFSLALFIGLVELFAKYNNSIFLKFGVFGLIAINSLTFARGAVYNGFMVTFLPAVFLGLVFYCYKFMTKMKG